MIYIDSDGTVNAGQHGVTMTTPLTTFDGYPRDDIDVAQSMKTFR